MRLAQSFGDLHRDAQRLVQPPPALLQAYVLHQLLNDHVGLTAVLLVQGLADGALSKSDANRIANRLIDARLTALQAQDNA